MSLRALSGLVELLFAQRRRTRPHSPGHLCYDERAHEHRDRAPGREDMEWTLLRWWIRSLTILRQRGRQDGVHSACNFLSVHGCCTSGVASRVTPDADADRGGSQEDTWDRDRDEVERGVDAGAVWIAGEALDPSTWWS